MLMCKIDDKILDFDYILCNGSFTDLEFNSDELDKIKDIIIKNNSFIYIGCGTIVDDSLNEQRPDICHFFQKPIDYIYSIINSSLYIGVDISASTTALIPNYSKMHSLKIDETINFCINNEMYQKTNLDVLLTDLDFKQQCDILEYDLYSTGLYNCPPAGRDMKQHKFIMGLNTKGKKWKK